jgi:hypothetical protein
MRIWENIPHFKYYEIKFAIFPGLFAFNVDMADK